MKKTLTLALTASTCLFAGSLFADHEADIKVKTDKKHYRTEFKSGEQCSAKHLIGARLNDAQGKKIGTIEDLVIDSGRVQFAVVRLDGDLAAGKAYTPIPMAALRPESTRAATTTTAQPGTYILTVDRSKLLSASRFNVERWPSDQTTVVWGPDVYSHYGMSWDATGAPGSEVYIQRGDADRGLEYKDTIEPPTDFREKSVDNGTAPDGKTTFPFLHEQTDQD
jgi:hypothetical protein